MRQAERDDDATTVAAAMAVLRRLYGDHIPQPTASHVSRWGSDPYSLGALPGCLPAGSSRPQTLH